MMRELITVKEPQLYTMGLWLSRDDPAGKAAAFNDPNPEATRLFRYGYASLEAATRLLQQLSPSVESRQGQGPVRLPAELRESLRNTALHNECPLLDAPVPCRPAAKRYRTADGTCNNRKKPRKGAALTPLQRFLPPQYHDGLQTARRSIPASLPLPSPRLISTTIHRPRHQEAPSITLLLMQWGQLIDHDVTSTPQARAFNGSTPRCCGDSGRAFLPMDLLHPECMPIEVPADDWFFGRMGLRCMEFVRSAPTVREGCDFGHRQQMNQVTAYIDASTIYGSSVSQADSIRLFRSGLIHYGQPDPPNGGEPCRAGAVSSQCLRPGDGRASEQPALTALHITWVRKHNMLAMALSHLNPHWSDEKMFQEARRIVGAMVQHITFREFLPIVLGHEVLKLFDLELVRKGYFTSYESRVNPSISNGFSAAAYRFGHSLVQSSFVRSDRFHRPMFNNVSMHEEQSNMENIWSAGSVDRLMLGLANQPSQKRDEFISEELTNHLFQSPGFPFGMDLAAINIQRGRDHGLPPYIAWRQPCGLSLIRNWTDLQRVMSLETAERFRSVYLSVDDIDLFSAGLAERPVRGGLVGPTFACIIAQQFSNLRRGDRFWYENGNFESSFTPAQLQQIRKVTFAQIICETMSEVDTIQPFVFLTPDNFRNQREMCRNLIDFDLTQWIEKSDFDQNNKFNQPMEQFTDNDVEMKSELTDDEILDDQHRHTTTQNNFRENNADQINHNDNLTKQFPTQNDNLKRTKRQTKTDQTSQLDQSNKTDLLATSRSLSNNKFDTIEHRESDDLTLTMTNSDISDKDSDDDTTTIPTNLTDSADLTRNERKRKRPSRRKPKPKPTTNIPIVSSTTARSINSKNKYILGQKQISYFGSNYQPSPYYQSQEPYYNMYDIRPPSSSNPEHDEILITPTKRPSNNMMTYLFNTVRKTTTTSTTTPKPDYQFHIQINYFYNSTTESYPRPTKTSTNKRPTQTLNNNRPNDNYYRPNQNNFDYNTPTSRPTGYNFNSRPNIYNVHELEDQIPSYSAHNVHNAYPNDKIDFGHSGNKYSTAKPPVVTSRPITIVEFEPANMQNSLKPNRPNVYFINDNDKIYEQSPPRPNFHYNTYNNRPQTFNQNRPMYETKPDTVIYKRPVTGQVTKLDTIPVNYNQQNNPNYYGPETVYDNKFMNYPDDRKPTTYRQPYNNINDKLDFYDDKKFVKISSAKKNMFTTARPFDDDKRFVRISTVKGHATKTDSMSPIYISVQNKESNDDLEMAYDDLLEVFVKPDPDFVHSQLAPDKNSDDKLDTLNNTSNTNLKTLPLTKQNDDLCSTELPRPMDLFIEDELFDL